MPAPAPDTGLSEIARTADPHIRHAVQRLLDAQPIHLTQLAVGGDLLPSVRWLVHAWHGTANADDAGPVQGATLVLRRRIIDALRNDLLGAWAVTPPPAAVVIETMTRLERLREACVPAPDQALAAELADHGGLDLVVEVGHDMRSPLTSIMFLSETLHRGHSGGLNDVQRRQVGIIYSAALRLVGMASDMIEVAQGASRLSSRSAYAFSVNEMLSSVRDLATLTAEEKGLDLRVGSLSAPHRLGYPVPLSRVLLNLTTNAMKFTDHGYVEVTAEPVEANVVEFAVRDTGPGIDDDALATLYQPFRREPRRETGYSFSGTGLGLSICRRLVDAMGSRLELETRRDWGTRFSFRLELPPASLL
jgi:signal transduction histidine kinase